MSQSISAEPATEQRGTGNGERATLVVQTAFLGDVVLTVPLLRQLAAQFGPVDVVATPAAVPLLTGQPAVRRVIPFDKRGADRGISGLVGLARVLKGERYARAFLPHRSFRSALLARLAGIPERIGFAGGMTGLVYTRRIARPVQGHESQRLTWLAGSVAPAVAPWFSLTADDHRAAESWLEARALVGAFVVLAPGAKWPTKRWPYFAELAGSLPLPVVVIGGPEDRAVAQSVADMASGRGHSAAGELTLPQSAALMERAALVVSNDSVALHLAVALARPVVAVVGPTGPSPGFEPLSPDDVLVAHPALACRPCSPHGHRRCPLGHHRCMQDLKTEQVQAAVLTRLAKSTPNAERGTGNEPGQ